MTNVLSVSAPGDTAPVPPDTPPADAPPPADAEAGGNAATDAVTVTYAGWDPVPQQQAPRSV